MNPLSLWCPLSEAFYTALADNSYFVSFELTLALLCLKINAFQFMEDDCQVLSLNQSFARRAASPFDAVCSGINVLRPDGRIYLSRSFDDFLRRCRFLGYLSCYSKQTKSPLSKLQSVSPALMGI